jgi:hypothetical protein
MPKNSYGGFWDNSGERMGQSRERRNWMMMPEKRRRCFVGIM